MKHETVELLRFFESYKRILKKAFDELGIEIKGIEYLVEHIEINRIKFKIEKLIEEEFEILYTYNGSEELKDFNTLFINFDESLIKFFINKNENYYEVNKEGVEKFIDAIVEDYLKEKNVIDAAPKPKPKNIIERIFTFSIFKSLFIFQN